MASSKLPDLIITYDQGASKTKIVAQLYPNGFPEIVLIEPEIADVGRESLMECVLEGTPSNNCWVGIPGDGHYALGFLARTQFGGLPMLNELKYSQSIPKICGALWVLQQRFDLPVNFIVAIVVLLPPAEVQDKEQLLCRLQQAFKGFETPTGKLKPRLLFFETVSEGSGVLSHRQRVLGKSVYFQQKIALLMVGYRNASIFVLNRGKMEPGSTSDFGMSWMVNKFVSRVSGLSATDPKIMPLLVAASARKQEASSILAELSRKRSPQEIATDSELFAAALEKSRDDYVRALTRWVRSILPLDTNEIILCGGTAEYVQTELDTYFQASGISITWNGGVEVPTNVGAGSMSSRLADVWAMHSGFQSHADTLFKYERVPKPTPSDVPKDAQKPANSKSSIFLPMSPHLQPPK